MEQLIGFLSNYRFSEQAPPPPAEFREKVFAYCLQSSSETISSPASNVSIPRQVAALLAEAMPVTSGAAQRIAVLREAFPILELLIGDKMFKAELRAYAAASGMPDAAQRLISAAATLREVSRRPIARWDRPHPGPAALAAQPLVVPPRTTRSPPQHFARPVVSALPVDALFEQLANENADITVLVTPLRAVANSEERIRLLLHYRAWQRGEVQLAAAAQPYFLAEVVRSYTAMNANESAHRIASRLAAEFCAPGGPADNLPAREVARFRGLHARACLRSGRVLEAQKIYRSLFYQNLSNPGTLIEYFNAIFANDGLNAEAIGRSVLFNNVEVDYFGCIALAEFFFQRGALAEALSFIQRAEKKAADQRQHILTLANIAQAQGDNQLWYELIRRFGETGGMPVIAFDPLATMRVFALSGTTDIAEPREELVSIVMTSFNASATIERAARSVLAQVGVNIELVIVDDLSTDNSREIISALAAADSRVTPVFNDTNMGTYASKNHGMTIAKGDILGFHDSDDWMHPMKVNRQLNELMRGFVCTTSQWLRMREDGRVVSRLGRGYTHLNPASTMFRRELIGAIGPFDYVRTGADAEYLTRIRLRYGARAVSDMPDCLALGLHHEASLTQSGATAFDENRYSPVRLAYTEAWVEWHLARLERGDIVELRSERSRPFEVPKEISV